MYTQNLEFYVGDDSNYLKNTKCPGGPFLVVDNYSTSYKYGGISGYGDADGWLWNYGVELWCNL